MVLDKSPETHRSKLFSKMLGLKVPDSGSFMISIRVMERPIAMIKIGRITSQIKLFQSLLK